MGAPPAPPPKRRGRRPALFLLANGVAALILLSCVFSFHYSAASTAIHSDQLLGFHSLTAVLQPWLPEGGDDLLQRIAGGGGGEVFVHRSSFAASMEHALDGNTTVGICEDGRPLLAGAPEHICKPMVCLWSARLQRNIDLSFHGLADLPWDAHPERCPEPAGGQTPTVVGESPQVSLVLLSGSDAQLAAQGLLEIFRTSSEAGAAEILVVDSTGGTGGRLLERAAGRLVDAFGVGVRLVGVPPTAAPWAAVQQGLDRATAPVSAVVAAGTFVTRGWLYALLHTLKAHPSAGVVGPLVLQQEQLVLDAGGLVRSDGSVDTVGQDAQMGPDYSYLRAVDFVSHSCFVIRMRAWREAADVQEAAEGLPGLLADASVMLALTRAGHTTLVQPASVVFHHTEAVPWRTELEEDCRQLFRQRWQHLLSPPVSCQVRPPLRGMWERSSSKALMWVDDVVPMPDNDSGSVRTMSLLKILVQEGYHVTYQPLLVWRRSYALPLQMQGIRVLGLAKPHQWQVVNKTGGCMYDGFVVARRTNYAIARTVMQERGWCQDMPQVFDTVDLHFMREARELTASLAIPNITRAFDLVEWMDLKAPALAENNQNISKLLGWRSQECELIRTADAAFLVSPDEIKVMEHYVPDSAPRLHLITNIHDDVVPRHTSCTGREGLLFVGNYNHAPNREAVTFLLVEILPRIRRRLPERLAHLAHAHIVGAGKPTQAMQELLAANAESATFYGYLPDDQLRLLYSRVKVVIAPLLTGAGVKGKVNQAMKLGVPVVGTKVALEGMHPQDGVNCMVANSAQGLAKKVVEVFKDCALWERLAEGGLKNMQKHFSIDTARPGVLAAFAKIGLGLPAQPRCKLRRRRRLLSS